MTNVYRTLTRCAGYVGLAGCLLAGTSSLAVAAPKSIFSEVKNDGFGTDCGQACRVVKVKWAAKHTNLPGAVTRYSSGVVPVAMSRVRAAAVAQSIGKMVPHPGLQLAIAAAGFAWAQMDGTYTVTAPDPESDVNDYSEYDVPHEGCVWDYNGAFQYETLAGWINLYANQSFNELYDFTHAEVASYTSGGCPNYRTYWVRNTGSVKTSTASAVEVADSSSGYDYNAPEVPHVAASDTQLEELDQYLPAEIVDQVFEEPQTYLPWQGEIDAMPKGDSVTTNGNVAPEVVESAIKAQENLDAQLQGQDEPHADTETEYQTAEDKILEEMQNQDEESVPPFTQQEVEWQTEEIELPSFSSGIGEGSCPVPRSIELPMGQSLELSFEPACNLATMIRPALVGICGLIALMIVVRARGNG